MKGPSSAVSGGLESLDLGDELAWNPIRVVPPGPWVGHLPFAYWLAKALRPATFVELGTHSGNSYFAFCQGLAAFSPGVRAFAVDTWEGDEHAGAYGEDVFADVSLFNRENFRQFSTLLRTTFDDARAYFGDGTVDLLHIDGMHSYEAVRHDFETWRTALTARGVVVFHDTNVRERDFGVWRFWQEVSAQHPHFEFSHSNGLGVLGVGPDQPPALRALFALAPAEAAAFRQRVAARGETLQRALEVQEANGPMRAAVEAAKEARAQAEAVRAEAAWRAELLTAEREVVAAKDAMLASLADTAAARAAALETRDRIIRDRDLQMMELASELRSQREAHEAALASARREREEAAAAAAERVAQADAAANAAAVAAAAAEAHAAAVARSYVNSTSWRLTRPLRVATRLLRHQGLRPPAVAAPPPAPPSALAPAPAPLPVLPPPAVDPPAAAPPLEALKSALRGMLSARLQAFLAGTVALRLPRAARPDVSIILVLYNQAELTFACLGSMLETLSGADAPGTEVLVVDNGSTDATPALLDRVEGATVIRNGVNLHFLKAVNLAARQASGRTILLLNNDAQLLPGAVASALRTLLSEPGIGAVGGRIILPDGTLQEAGSIVWQDGACSGYGRGDNPGYPDYMFQRDVDFCSGAFLLTRTADWEALGGFDERFAPAYYEEVDYCVRLWRSGKRVVFDPDVAILHFEFGSSASAAEALALQAKNHEIFVARHRDWLAGQFPASPYNAIAARTARSDARRVLVIDDRVPKPELGTGYPRANRLLHELAEAGAQVAFYPIHRYAETWQSVRRVLDKRIEVLIAADHTQLRAYLEARRGHFDAILVCRPPNMEIFEKAVGYDRSLIGDAVVLYDAEALFVTRALQRREADGNPASVSERHRLVASEVALTRLADAVISVTPAERAMLETYGAKQVHLLVHSLDDAPLPTGYGERDQVVFLGAVQSDDAPNAVALRWFADEIVPGVRPLLGAGFQLQVVGKVEAPSVKALDGGPIRLVGMVDDLSAALGSARVMVVPSRLGAGIPLKALQAAMLGIPMVVTPLIAGQLGWQDGEELLVADDPAAFAQACARLYSDEGLWRRVRERALERVRRECAPDAFAARVRALLAEVPLARRRPEPPADEAEAPRRLAPPAPEPAAEPNTSRPAEADFSAAVPFGYAPQVGQPPPAVGVMCHLFYPEIGPEVLGYLGNLPLPADLFLSTDTEAKAAELRATFAAWQGGAVDVRVVPNRGRDIAPKLVGFADAYDRYDLVLHLHSKVSHHAEFLAPWRGFLFEGLLGSRAVVSSILDAFARLPDLGMVAPQHYEAVRRWLGWNGNFGAAQGLASRMGITLSPTRALDFPSGSMFWARPAALRPLLDLHLRFEDFPEEGAQVDHTPAHAIERLYFHVCERSGHSWIKVAQRALYADTSTVVDIPTPAALSRYVAEHGVLLGGPARLPCRKDPAPMMTQVPPGLARRLASRRVPQEA